MEVPSGMGYAEMRDHLDRRMSQDRRKIAPEASMEKRRGLGYAEIRDYLDPAGCRRRRARSRPKAGDCHRKHP